MLQVLSWNAYTNDNSPPVSNPSHYLPTPDTPRPPQSALSRNNKRKRTSDINAEAQCQDWPVSTMTPASGSGDQLKVATSTFSNSLHSNLPPLIAGHQPSDGLPTPVLSPTSTHMNDETMREASPRPLESDTTEARSRKIRQVATQQVNLEILLKHSELRLIDQEIAKCQVALEQLRRCTELPYPATQLSESVTKGTGPALRHQYAGARLPTSPAPWGVIDGPYSRHYATWLLPDSRFDGGEPDLVASAVASNGKRPAKGRHGRPSIVEDMNSAGMSSRAQRAQNLQALAPGYAPPKEKSSGPLLLKRKSDGAMVKLKCPDCGRLDFGSAQGFINHCRIGHSRTFASHDAAAEHCGEVVEYDAKGAMVGIEPVVTAPTTTSVHSMVRSAHLLPKSPAAVPKLSLQAFDGAVDSPEDSTAGKGGLTPFLAALLQKQNMSIDLKKEVTDAKEKIELPEEDVDMSDDDSASIPEAASSGAHPQVAGTRQIAQPTKAPATSPILTSRLPVNHPIEQDDGFGHPIEPSPTTESTQAPSLIDDDEEYEAHSPASTPASELAEEELQFHIRDDDEPHQDEMARTEFQPSCTRPQQSVARRPSAFRKETDFHEEKHVSFNSSNPSPGEQKNADRSKRRKITK